MQKGQYYRLFLSINPETLGVIAAAKNMTFHATKQVEESSTKDSTGDALEYEETAKSYEITGSGLVLTPNDTLIANAKNLNNFEQYLLENQTVLWHISKCSGANNRVEEEEILSGEGRLTNLSIQATNKQNAEYNYTIKGYGSFSIVDGA